MDDLLYFVWLSRVFPYGSEKPRLLLDAFAAPKAVCTADRHQLEECPFLNQKDIKTITSTSLSRAELIIHECEKKGIRIITYQSEEYPERIRNIYNPPMVLYVRGDFSGVDNEVALAVVGTREASEYGLRLTGNLCYELTKAGAVIVSGCAVGIDTYAHRGALKAGGRTIAVLGCGLDIDYPSANKALKRAILEKGALVTECAPGEHPTRSIFPVRNRLMSALGLGVLVTEAPLKSGALITANQALEQGKDLFCVPPHDIYSANFAGVTDFIRDGAISVFSAKDVLEEYFALYPHKLNARMKFAKPFAQKKTVKKPEKPVKKQTASEKIHSVSLDRIPQQWDNTLSDKHRKMYDIVNETPRHIDDITAEAGMTSAEAGAVATELELLGFIVSHSGKRYSRNG